MRTGCCVNRGVARKLGVVVGDTVVALGNTSDGRMSAVRLKVTGVWWIRGLEAYEWGACYADIAAVQELVDAPDQAGVLVLRQRDPRAPSAPIAASLNALFAREQRRGPGVHLGGHGRTLHRRHAGHALRREHHGPGDDRHRGGGRAQHGAHVRLRAHARGGHPAGLRCPPRPRPLPVPVGGGPAGLRSGRRGRRLRGGPRGVLRPLRHPRVQRGAALLVRRRPPLPAARLGVRRQRARG